MGPLWGEELKVLALPFGRVGVSNNTCVLYSCQALTHTFECSSLFSFFFVSPFSLSFSSLILRGVCLLAGSVSRVALRHIRISRVCVKPSSFAMDGLGFHHMWGMSPAMDLNELADKLKIKERSTDGDENPSASSSAPINILLIKPADVRSIVKTVTQRHRLKTKRPLHFYVWEETAELLARHLLLLQVFQEWKIPIRQRCNLWLEIFGNVLVQERTMHYIDAKGRQLVKLVCDQAGPLAGIVDTSLLKFVTLRCRESNNVMA